jgi:diguanylate cyclase (GGDEF)-like protein
MRKPPLALFSGIGRRVALAVAACGIVVLSTGLLLQTGKQLRQYRDLQQQQLRQVATQAAMTISSRISSAEAVMHSALTFSPSSFGNDTRLLRTRLNQAGMFGWHAVVEIDSNGFATVERRQFRFTPAQREAIEAGRAIMLTAVDATEHASLILARQMPSPAGSWVLIAEVSSSWLWSPLRGAEITIPLVGIDTAGRQYFSTLDHSADVESLVAQRPGAKSSDVTGENLAWNARGLAWVGAVTPLHGVSAVTDVSLAVVATDHDRTWGASFQSALRTQGLMLLVVLLLAALSGHVVALRYVPTLRKLRRALAQLPEHRVLIEVDRKSDPEIRQIVETFNRSSGLIAMQWETQHAIGDIDALLLAGGDFENVIDQVLARVRDVTDANNVGLTLIDPGASGHGRMFAVNTQGGFPVNRVVLDEQMASTLLESVTGLTVVRCEAVRHSFLAPLQTAGSSFFWVWPVVVNEDLAAILVVGYAEPPEYGARVAGCGTLCAQRLGASLSSSARAERLYHQAHFDLLTQLPNRLLFRDRLSQELASAADSTARGALLYIDLDHFKKVNDTLGHEAGDQLLSIVAQRLRACVKEGDTVARLGGDEFTVILRHVMDTNSAQAVADRIIQSMQMPVRLGGGDHHVRASIGITLFPDDGTKIDDLLHNADLAMYRAKEQGRGGAVFYNAKMSLRSARVADSGLYRALKRREFSLYFQPQYRVADGALIGVEALLRWQTPRDGLLTSADFIPAAEESGLIVDLGGWVLESACAQIAQWREQGLAVPRVAVNLSVQQLRDPGLVPNLQRLLERFRVRPSSLEFELNEAALTDHDSQACIAQLSAMGAGLTLDDFGTGHTALANLRRYPVAAVKIDRSFVDELVMNPAAAALASTIIVMAHSLDKQVVAEGVETMEQFDFLRERGCDVAQGYFMARPLSAAAMTDMLLGRQPEESTARSAIA